MNDSTTTGALVPRLLERWVPFAAAAALLAACALTSARKHFWHDEVFSWTIVTDPSTVHMLRAIAGGAEAAPPLYHLGARLWLLLAGQSELALRLWSSLGFALSLVILWRVLRRGYAPATAVLAAVAAFCASPLLWYQNGEARFYGTFMLVTSLALAATDAAARPSAGTPARAQTLLALAASHSALVLSHPFGFLYSGALLGGMLGYDVARPLRAGPLMLRWRSYAAIVAGWTVFALWLPAFLTQADLGRPHTWISVPTMDALRDSYGTRAVRQLWTVVLAVAVVLWLARVVAAPRAANRAPAPTAAGEAGLRPGPLPWLAATLLLVPVGAFVISHLMMSIFVDRYMLPTLLGVGIVIASAIRGMGWAWHVTGRRGGGTAAEGVRVAMLLGALALLVLPLRWAAAAPRFPVPGARLARMAHEAGAGTPVITESPLEYLPAAHYSGAPARPFYFVLDWESALDSAAALHATVDYKIMSNWRRWGYLAAGIVESEHVLCAMPRFIVVDEPGRLWFDRRISSNARYRTSLLATESDTAAGWLREKRIVLVERVGAADPTCEGRADAATR